MLEPNKHVEALRIYADLANGIKTTLQEAEEKCAGKVENAAAQLQRLSSIAKDRTHSPKTE